MLKGELYLEIMPFKNLEELLQNRIFYYFNQICQIPHQSYKEKELSDFLLGWANNLGLNAVQDKHNNIFIKKPASTGYEGIKPVILQAHIDMVCEKDPEVAHDFSKDPIALQLDGDILSTGKKTTLGADNGIGVAMAMAILESNSIDHPPIEVLFTTAEEEDLSGAISVNPSWFSTNRLINLDHAVEGEVIAGSCGGVGVKFTLPSEFTTFPKEFKAFKVSLDGLTGGHSGEDIHRGRGNANVLLARLLHEYKNKFNFLIGDICGGNFRLAIPREAYATIIIDPENIDILKDTTNRIKAYLDEEYLEAEPNFKIELQETTFESEAITESGVSNIINAIILSPNGIEEMNGTMNVVESSCNLGELYMLDDCINFVYEIRAAKNSSCEYVYEKINIISKLLGANTSQFAKYPGWAYRPDSELRDLTQKTYRDIFGKEMKSLVVHCGLECGCFYPKIHNLDAISIGPNIWSLHSPSECASVSSIDRVFMLLCEILKNLK